MLKPGYKALIEDVLWNLKPNISENKSGIISLLFTFSETLTWKGKPIDLSPWDALPPLNFSGSNQIEFKTPKTGEDLSAVLIALSTFCYLLKFENPQASELWGDLYETPSELPTGFSNDQTPQSQALLKRIYEDGFIVAEKKPLVIDLDRSQGSYIVSIDDKRVNIIDSAAQIASLGLGLNESSKSPMELRTEIFDRNLDLENWDVTEAYKTLLQEQTGMDHVYFVNSGSESIETALKICQSKYPDRKHIISFEGSFHGRTLLALHSTHSPAKRAPFEIYPGTAVFLKFPEDKNPDVQKEEPQGWVETWADSSDLFKGKLDAVKSGADPLLSHEIECLQAVRDQLKSKPHLALLIEPMQCEGGDRYGTPRFFRALRVLTRAFQTPMIIDEVQTGYHLGDEFFWHRSFCFQKTDGSKDFPDVVCSAKKGQVGICITNMETQLPIQTSAASIYRGYLQATALIEYDLKPISAGVKKYLSLLKDMLGDELVAHARGRGLCFAFDLPSAEIMNALVAKRFENGTLFYPAGEKTARFRLMASTTKRDLYQIFSTLYKCFEALSNEKKIKPVPSYSDWSARAKEIRDPSNEAPRGDKWKRSWSEADKEALSKLDGQTWNHIFRKIIKRAPSIIKAESHKEFTTDKISTVTLSQLWDRYQSDRRFTKLELLWHAARAFGHPIRKLNRNQVGDLRPKIKQLQETVYEPARQDDPEMFFREAEDRRTCFLAMITDDGTLAGICASAPLGHFRHIKMVDTDSLADDERSLYGVDLSIHPDYQGQGLGLRMKAEQVINAYHSNAHFLRSRNRIPNAKAMSMMNHSFGAVSIELDHESYEGDSTCAYQSITMAHTRPYLGEINRYIGAVKNKVSLGNFVSPSYVSNMLFLKELLPFEMRHVYLASGLAESVDKALKLMIHKKAGASVALSFNGHHFGNTTAVSRSLGDSDLPYFDWPTVKNFDEFKKTVTQIGVEKILGCFIEPINNNGKLSSSELIDIIDFCRDHKLATILNETRSGFYEYNDRHFFCSSDTEINPDGIVFYPGGQLGVLAVNKETFFDEPLKMISTWDGDEHSLNLLRDRALESIGNKALR